MGIVCFIATAFMGLANPPAHPITDRKTLTGNSFSPVVQTATDYYAFGAPIAERSYNAGQYRYGFNTQEKTDEIAGAGNHTTALFWEYDTRTGRRWNLDPKPQIAISDYAVNRNNPIYYNDPDGAKPGDYYDRQGNYLGTDGKQDNKTYLFNSGVSAIREDNRINWGGTLSITNAKRLQKNSIEVGGLIIQNRIEEGKDYTILIRA